MGGETNRINENLFFLAQTETETQPDPAEFSLFDNENLFPDSNRDRFLGFDIQRFRLNQQFDQPPTAPPNPDPQKVENALGTIRDSLSEGILDWDVTHGDLQTIRSAFNGLTREEANEVFRQLSDAEVQKWADELSGIIGGYDESEKRALFGDLAGKLDGANLARLGNALLERERGKLIETSDVTLLSEAIAGSAPESVKNEYLQAIAGRIERDEQFALGAAHVLASLRDNPQALENALRNLSDGQLRAIVKAASQETLFVPFMSETPQIRFDTTPLVNLLDAVSSIQDPTQKARVFEAAALQMKEISEAGSTLPTVLAFNKGEQTALVRDALTRLINSDTNGIVRQLRLNDESQRGDAMVAYMQTMIQTGQADGVSQILRRLAAGPQNINPKDYLEQSVTSRDGRTVVYNNAEDLGYVVGSVEAATSRIATTSTKQVEIFAKILGAAVDDIAGARNIPGGAIAGATVEEVSKAFLTEMVRARNRPLIENGDRIVDESNPRNAGELTEGAIDAYEKMLDRVADRQDRYSRRN